MEIKNRVAMAAMGDFGLVNVDGTPNQRFVEYFIERARGGVGLLVTGILKVETQVEPVAPGAP